MSLLWKVVFVLAVVLAMADSAIHHRHHKQGQFHKEMSEKGKQVNFVETLIHGRIYCDGTGIDGLKPFLNHPWFAGDSTDTSTTTHGGFYTLLAGKIYERWGFVYLTIRHQCEVKGLAPRENCATPYFKTDVKFDLSTNTTSITRYFELSTMEDVTNSRCLE